uniref:Uncharacterized protein n=1 Tax=uncultured Alphaproteobacteria bacterium TaxID=91750 RepID=A0A6M4NQT7_9PROT|nr:hypothetical protein PlAlph_1690 [uncultured Alphaproteobacteria bacterium]
MNEEDIQNLINQALSCTVMSRIPLSGEQMDALQNLNEYCVNLALQMPEVAKKPLKVVYKSNEEFKIALMAFCLCQSLTNPRRKLRENKEFFEKNITIYHLPNNVKEIDFGEILPENVAEAINWEVLEDWKLYRDNESGGIKALVDEKTRLTGLETYRRGGDPLYEFARFHRKFTEKENKIAEESRIQAQNSFRNAVIQSVTSEVAKQQLLAGMNPMDIINTLLSQESDLQLPPSRSTMPQIINRNKK